MKIIFKLLLSFIIIKFINGYGECNIYNIPTWKEREAHLFTNLVRMDPQRYKILFMQPYNFTNLDQLLLEPQYHSVQPLYYNLSLSDSSRYHSYDMNLKDYFNHTDLNGVSFSKRIKQFTQCNNVMAENIAAGPYSGFRANNILLCEGSRNCIPDNDIDIEKIGHRINIMASKYSLVGVGFMRGINSNSKYATYWTMNFGNSGKCIQYIPSNTPIHSGSHTFLNDKKERSPTFIVTFSSSKEEINKMELHIQSTPSPIIMNQIMGFNSSFAVYSYQSSTFTKCNWYYYLAHTKSGNSFRYPSTGVLKLSTSNSNCYSWSSESISNILKPNIILFISTIIIIISITTSTA